MICHQYYTTCKMIPSSLDVHLRPSVISTQNMAMQQGCRSLWDRGDISPNIYEGGDIHGNVPSNILEVIHLGCRLE